MDTGDQYLLVTAMFAVPMLIFGIWLHFHNKKAKEKKHQEAVRK